MRTDEMARDYLDRATWCLNEAERALSKENYPICVRRSQEALELAVKALLRSFAVEYPKEQDVGDAVAYIEEKLPDSVRSEIASIKKLLTELSRVRGPAFYGYERESIPASKAFSEAYAREIFGEVQNVVTLLAAFLEGLSD